MALTAALVFAGPNRLRYLLSQDGAAGTDVSIPSAGGATPDLVTDSVGGQIKALAKADVNGYGPFAAPLSADESAALWLSDNVGTFVITQHDINAMPTAICRLTPRTGASSWQVKALANGVINADGTTGAPGSAYLDIEIPGAEGV